MEGFVERAGPRPEGQEHIVNPERVNQGQRGKFAVWISTQDQAFRWSEPSSSGFSEFLQPHVPLTSTDQNFHKHFHPEFSQVGIFPSTKERRQWL